jgi:hypothetical protein
VKFTAAEGANRHCEPMGLAVRDARVFDWLDRYLTTEGTIGSLVHPVVARGAA